MVIAVVCDQCRRTIKAKETLAGKRVKCPACGAVVTVPSVGRPGAPEPVESNGAGLNPRWLLGGGAVLIFLVGLGLGFLAGRIPQPAGAVPAANEPVAASNPQRELARGTNQVPQPNRIAEESPAHQPAETARNLEQGVPADEIEKVLRDSGYDLPENGVMETATNASTGKTTRQFFRQCKNGKTAAGLIYMLDPDDVSHYSLRSGEFTGDDAVSREAFISFAGKISPALGAACKEVQGKFEKDQKRIEKRVGKFWVRVTKEQMEFTTLPPSPMDNVASLENKAADQDAPKLANLAGTWTGEAAGWTFKELTIRPDGSGFCEMSRRGALTLTNNPSLITIENNQFVIHLNEGTQNYDYILQLGADRKKLHFLDSSKRPLGTLELKAGDAKPDAATADPPATSPANGKSPWSAKIAKATKGPDRRVAIEVEFETSEPEVGTLEERLAAERKLLSEQAYDYLRGKGETSRYVERIGGDLTTAVLAKPSRLLLSRRVELDVTGKSRLQPTIASLPAGLLEFKPSGREIVFGFASTKSVSGSDPPLYRFVKGPDETAALVPPGKKILMTLEYVLPDGSEKAGILYFYNHRPLPVVFRSAAP